VYVLLHDSLILPTETILKKQSVLSFVITGCLNFSQHLPFNWLILK